MNIRLEKNGVIAEISPLGAEWKRFAVHGRELLWPGDAAIWPGSSPWLFPVVGRLRNDAFSLGGAGYALPQHGFAKDSLFSCLRHTADEAVFLLCDSPETRAAYPWRFALRVGYRLTGNGMEMEARVENPNAEEMYFSLGAHPGFFAAAGDRLIFDAPGRMRVRRLERRGHLLLPWDGETAGGEILLRPELFDRDAMILEALAARAATLRRRDGTRLRIDYGDVSFLGLWSMPGKGMPYVCVEPWLGVDDPVDADGDIRRKRAIERLQPGESRTLRLAITVEEREA